MTLHCIGVVSSITYLSDAKFFYNILEVFTESLHVHDEVVVEGTRRTDTVVVPPVYIFHPLIVLPTHNTQHTRSRGVIPRTFLLRSHVMPNR